MMASLSTLRRLRLLVLQGNPLALLPYYRGFTIDSLSQLCVLDDITVSPSEKHQFRGLGRSGGEGADVPSGEGPASDTSSLCCLSTIELAVCPCSSPVDPHPNQA